MRSAVSRAKRGVGTKRSRERLRTERQLVHVGLVARQHDRERLERTVVRDAQRKVLVQHSPGVEERRVDALCLRAQAIISDAWQENPRAERPTHLDDLVRAQLRLARPRPVGTRSLDRQPDRLAQVRRRLEADAREAAKLAQAELVKELFAACAQPIGSQ